MAVKTISENKLNAPTAMALLSILLCFSMFFPESHADTSTVTNESLAPFHQAQSIHVAYSKRRPNLVRGDDIFLEEIKYAFQTAGFLIEPVKSRADLILELYGTKKYSYEYYYTVVGNVPTPIKVGIEVTIEALFYRQGNNIYRISESTGDIRDKLPKGTIEGRSLGSDLENEAEDIAIDGLNAKLEDLLNLVSKHQRESARQ